MVGTQQSNRSPLGVASTQGTTKSSEVTRTGSQQVTPRRKTKWVKWIKVSPNKARGESTLPFIFYDDSFLII